MTEPQTPHTVIYTEHVTAERLREMRGHLPMSMFVSDGDERVNPNGGWLRYSASNFRVVRTYEALHGFSWVRLCWSAPNFGVGEGCRRFAGEMRDAHGVWL